MKPERHLIDLSPGWRLWRPFVLRGSGFPAQEVLRLALPEAARQVDALLALERAIERERSAILSALTDGARSGVPGAWGLGGKIVKKVLAGAPVERVELPPAILLSIEKLAELVAQRARASGEARQIFATDHDTVSAQIRALARDDRFREAVTWQNRAAASCEVDALARTALDDDTSLSRRHRRVVASYLQRYCTKADTIGFFGPASWGQIASQGAPLSVEPGATLLGRRTVYFEYWGIDALAQQLAALPGMKPWLAPRRRPTVRPGAGGFVLDDGTLVPASPAATHLASLCDGVRPAHAIVRAALGEPGSGVTSEEDGYRLLGEMQSQGVLLFTLEVPVGSPYPERALRTLLEGIGDERLRAEALAPLDELVACKEAVGRAAGQPDALARALEHTEQTFLRLTGRQGTRNAGRTYAGRTLLYEDCVRDLAIAIGPTVVAKLREPLALVLASARWWMHTIAERFRVVFREAFATLRASRGEDEAVSYAELARAVEPHFTGGATRLAAAGPTLVAEVAEQLQQRWAKILALAPDEREQRFRSTELAPAVAAAFDAPHSGAALLRYHCPDLMIAAPSVEAIERGELQIVLSELHTGLHTFASPFFLEFCDHPDAVVRAYGEDLAHVEVLPLLKKEMFIRGCGATLLETDVHVEMSDARSWLPRHQVLAQSDLFVEQVGDDLRVCHRRDGRTFDVLDFHVFFLQRAAANVFQMLPAARHSPRVVFDDLVVARECWRLDRAEIPIFDAKESYARFCAARAWAAKLGLPRFVFVKVPEEKKPFFVDLESSLYVDLFAHLARGSARITLTEMLADFSHAWLPDREGRRYLCELRMAVLDAKEPPPTT